MTTTATPQPQVPDDPGRSDMQSSAVENTPASHLGQHPSFPTPDFTPAASADEDQHVFGPSSNSAFAQQIASVAGSGHINAATLDSSPLVPAPLGYAAYRHPTIEYNLSDLVLPYRPLADSLLRCCWELFHPLFPVLHQPSFDAEYRQVWERATTSALYSKAVYEIVFYSTLNIVLAIGCQLNEVLAEEGGEGLAKELYKRSVRLVSVDSLDTSSLAIIQLLLLGGNYLLYTPFADRFWNTVGVALRAAQAIGLHTPEQQTATRSQMVCEMRRRVWYSCINLDW